MSLPSPADGMRAWPSGSPEIHARSRAGRNWGGVPGLFGGKRRYGTKAAFDYLVAEKLFNFADAASSHPAFARELPRFVAHVRGLFTVEEMRTHLNRIQCEQRDGDAYIGERDEFDEEGEQ